MGKSRPLSVSISANQIRELITIIITLLDDTIAKSSVVYIAVLRLFPVLLRNSHVHVIIKRNLIIKLV